MTRVAASVSVVLLVAGCAAPGAAPSDAPNSPTSETSAGPSGPAGTSPIVGVWQGEHDCAGIADALTQAGFDEHVVLDNIMGNGLLRDVATRDDVTDIATACASATTLEHSHEFTADGEFFSYDQDGNEVDFGTWRPVDDDTIVIGAPDRPDVEFDFVIEGDHLELEPQIEAGCLEFECQWAVMVAMPWSGMDRH